MRFLTLSLLALAVEPIVSRALPPSNHVVHEKRDFTGSERWIKKNRVAPHVKVPVRVGLKQNKEALERAQTWLLEVSHPQSEKYGQHWTQEEVIEAFQPTTEAVDKVTQWISETAGISKHRITHTDNKAWLAFDAKVEELEALVHAEYREHHDESRGRAIISCGKLW